MRRLVTATALLLLLFGGGAAGYAEGPEVRVRARLDPEGPVAVGQQVQLEVEFLVSTWFAKAPALPTLQIPHVVVISPDTFGANFNEQRDGVSWTGQRRRFLLYPRAPGRVEVPTLSLRVAPGSPDGEQQAQTARTRPLAFEARLPDALVGTSGAVTSPDFSLRQRLDADPEALAVGDALVRTIEQRAEAAPSLLLPPAVSSSPDGVGAYPAPPKLRDEFDRGASRGRRIDRITYVMERAGVFELPPFEVTWWDPASGRARTASAPGVRLRVGQSGAASAPARDDGTPAGEGETVGGGFSPTVVAIALLLVAVAFVAIRVMWTRVATARRAWANTPAGRFARARRAAAANDPAETYRALMAWLDAAGIPTLASWVRATGDVALRDEIERLEAALYGTSAGAWNGRTLADALARAGRGSRASHRRAPRALPPLNPRAPTARGA